MWVGVWAALKRGRHHGAAATASITIPLTIVGMFTSPGLLPVGAPILLFGVPAFARHLIVKGGSRQTAYTVTIDSSRRTTFETRGRDAASSAIEREA